MRKINFCSPILILIFALSFMLQGCGKEKNPIIGKWSAEFETGSLGLNSAISLASVFAKPYIEFNETSLVAQLGSFSADKTVTYRHDKDAGWYFCTEDGKLCELFNFTNEEQTKAEITFLNVKMTLTRMIEPEK